MSIITLGKKIVLAHPIISKKILSFVNHIPFNNKIKIKSGNEFEVNGSLLRKCEIQVNGRNNKIIIGQYSRLKNTKIYIFGDNNSIIISNKVLINSGELYIEDSNNVINIGEHTSICGKTHLACIEGCSISIGKNCLFSSDIVFRTGDSHSILNFDGERINPSKDIIIKDHVWIGNKVILTKNATIQKNSIIGTGSVVTKKFDKENIIIAGVPARIIKENINWDNVRF